MNEKTPTNMHIFASDQQMVGAVVQACADNAMQDSACIIVEATDDADACDVNLDSYACPVRIGKILADLQALTRVQAAESYYDFGGFRVYPNSLDLKHTATDDAQTIRLTEKERDILLFLARHKGQVIARDDLLKYVWEYVEGVETHTLETHIYRLRQKIEPDPSNPSVLLTDDDGYRLA